MQIVIINSKGGCGKSTLVASLADVLDADIIDHDAQGTITISSQYTNRHKPVTYNSVSKKIVIHDTPPYNSGPINSLLKEASIVLIPTKLRYPDLLAVNTICNTIKSAKAIKKTIIVFNEVRKPYTKTYGEIKKLYKENYREFNFANTELSNLISYARVLAEPLTGKALKEMKALKKELSIY